METKVKPIYTEGKIAFSTPAEAIDTQLALLIAGFKFESENQQPRPAAYGVMWRKEWIKGAWRMSIFTAGNESVFKAYGAHRKESIYNDGTHIVNNEPGRKKVFEVARAERAYMIRLTNSIVEYLVSLGYKPEAGRKGNQARDREQAWTAFIHLLKEIKPDFKPSQLRIAIRKRFEGAPDTDALLRFYRNPRPDWLKVSEVLAKL